VRIVRLSLGSDEVYALQASSGEYIVTKNAVRPIPFAYVCAFLISCCR